MSPIIDDLRIDAEIPPQRIGPGTSVKVALRFSNLATRPRTIVLRANEALRYGQSTFYLEVGGSKPPLVQPEPLSPNPSDGALTKADLHEIGPRSRLELSQSLWLPRDLALGTYAVRWIYENRDDGSALPRFGGEPIPGIWRGTLEEQFSVRLGGRHIGTFNVDR